MPTALALLVGAPCVTAVLAAIVLAADPAPSANPVDVGTKTSGVGTDRAVQPKGAPTVDVRPTTVPPGSGPDTPGTTGLGNMDRGRLGGADKGPGTEAIGDDGSGRAPGTMP
jgi:hypothetical protein